MANIRTIMLTFNNKKYAKNNDEFVSSLFVAGSTWNGFYKKTKNGIRLYDMQNKLQGFIVNNRHNERFIVSAGTDSTGKAFFMNGASDALEQWLGVSSMPRRDKEQALDALFV